MTELEEELTCPRDGGSDQLDLCLIFCGEGECVLVCTRDNGFLLGRSTGHSDCYRLEVKIRVVEAEEVKGWAVLAHGCVSLLPVYTVL